MAEVNINTSVKLLNKKVEDLNTIMIALVIVLFIGFAAMFGTIATLIISHFDNSQSTYQELRDQVQAQNAKVDELTQAIQNQQKSATSSTTVAR